MCHHAARIFVPGLLLALFAPLAAEADCSCNYDYRATSCCAFTGHTSQTTVQCSLEGYQWSCTDREPSSDPYITTSVWVGIGDYCSWDFIDAWVGTTACTYEKASCSTTTPGVCVWTERNLYCDIYNRPTRSSCGSGPPL